MGRPPCCASEPSLHAIALTCAGRVPSIRATYSRNNAATFVRQYWPHEYCMIGAAMHASAAAFPYAWRHRVSAADCARVRTTIRALGCLRIGMHHSTQYHALQPALSRPRGQERADPGGETPITMEDCARREPFGASGMARQRAAREAKPRRRVTGRNDHS